MDVSKEDQVNSGVEHTVKTFGRVDILMAPHFIGALVEGEEAD
jgi:hypothetical protein